jgi:hypothetical protein
MRWNPGADALVCPSCKTATPAAAAGAVVARRTDVDGFPPDPPVDATEITCIGCGAALPLEFCVISGTCSYCHAPFVAIDHRGPPYPDGVVPATLDISAVETRMADWARSRWLAPRSFRHGVQPTLALTYRPIWVIGADTKSDYAGERGEANARVDRRELRNDPSARTEALVTWFPVTGKVEHAFGGVLVLANGFGRPEVSWRLDAALPYRDDFLVGATAYAPYTPWSEALDLAEEEMKETITALALAEIGGAHKRVDSVSTSYSGLNYRYLLAPTWSGSYEWRGRKIELEVNAETGAVSGEAPRSKLKLGLAVLAVIAVLAAIALAVVL